MNRFFPPRPENLFIMRARSGVVAFYAFAIIGALLLGESAFRGRWDVVFSALPWTLLVLWVLYMTALQPYIGYTDRVVVVYNILRRHEFPWSAVSKMTDHHQFVFMLREGAPIKAWGGPVGGRPRGNGFGSMKPVDRTKATPLDHLSEVWQEGRGKSMGKGATTTWNTPALLLGLVLVIWALLTIA
ncbi:hypothetical protein D9V32_05955 [Mycetocola tolaasinivorans]|uniref:PH domain-containing protein n=1 Tax=Mycetocola tolaasinivorans TaxID=76635 RepID=A0A3L7A7V2_9MICO|nr:hypothetical protein [Mycetocola tolaasinivorans]RLP76409.1 hypothetical protein D9V32_05955 [Mycetocola tolaasinivorans]